VAYTEPVETFKEDLFQIDAGITSVRAGVAETGAVVLWPTPHEPRLMSLVPPVHVAVLDADTIYSSLAEMMAAENWAAGMPTNALLISGPSKTADIEFTLVFGVHGPQGADPALEVMPKQRASFGPDRRSRSAEHVVKPQRYPQRSAATPVVSTSEF
jgi:L-lactate utilization protein LutC